MIRSMTLAEYLSLPDPETGKRRRRYEFAARIGVQPSMITDYCEGRTWPSRDVMERIVAATDGAVTPNDFLMVPEKVRP
jgi:DNA-binding transcriptional regulator YdaS (Cro superfamily)